MVLTRVRACVRACVCEDGMNLHYVGIYTYQFIPHYASAIHKEAHTRILKTFEDSEPTGLKVDIAVTLTHWYQQEHQGYAKTLLCAT